MIRPRGVFLVALFACGERFGGDPYLHTHAASSALVDTCAATARLLCARANECEPRYVLYFFGTMEACEHDVAAVCIDRYAGPGADASPRVCDDARAVSCDRLLDPYAAALRASGAGLLASCSVTPGRLADGGACLRDGDCASGRCGDGDRPRCGVCTSPAITGRSASFGHEGAPCDGMEDCSLGLGFTCGDDHLCGAFTVVGDGESCRGVGDPKVGDRLCALGERCTDGRCVRSPPSSGSFLGASPVSCLP